VTKTLSLLAILGLSFSAWADIGNAAPDRIVQPISSSEIAAVPGTQPPLALPANDQGRLSSTRTLAGVTMVFRRSAEQQRELDQLLAAQQDKTSPQYHKWLTPEQFAARFGLSPNDVNQVKLWLESQGLTITRTSRSRTEITFSGTVGQVEAALHTEMHEYQVKGETHYANATPVSVPAAISGVVMGFRNLDNFHPKPHLRVNRHFTSNVTGNHFVVPDDFATIYDLQTLYAAGLDGSGESIAVAGQSTISLTDIDEFRTAANLPTNNPTLTLVPGTGVAAECSGDETESDLDVEWSGGVAKNANVIFLYAGLAAGDTCSARTYSAFDALSYAVDQNIAPVISISYGLCEPEFTLASAQSVQLTVQQGNAQGQTVVAAAGDSGAADCDYQVTSATQGFAVDVPAAIPEVTGAGGTEFFGDPASLQTTTYWNATNDADMGSAIQYIPEEGWNDTTESIADGGDLAAGGGGFSTFFSKPSWQTGVGVPAANHRYVPDIALNASPFHDAYLICSQDYYNSAGDSGVTTCVNGFRDSSGDLAAIGGTSAAAPSFAGVLAIINQGTKGSQGNANTTLYTISPSHPTAFHDVTTGNNIVPCTQGSPSCPATAPFQFGYSAGTGYDEVTGLGSIDGNVLAGNWPDFSETSFTLSAPSPASLSLNSGAAGNSTYTLASTNGFAGAVALACGGLTSAGITCSVNPTSLTLSSTVTSGTSTLNVITSGSTPAGTYSIPVTASFGTVNLESDLALTVTPPFTITPGSAITEVGSGSGTSTFTISSTVGFSGMIALTCSPSVSTLTCSFNPSSVTLSSTTTSATSVLTVNSGSTATGSYSVTGTATSGAVVQTGSVAVTVTPPFTVNTPPPTPSTISVAAGGSGTSTITVAAATGSNFSGAVNLACNPSSAISGISCSLSPASVTLSSTTTSATSTLTVVTTAASTSRQQKPSNEFRWMAASGGIMAGVFLLGVPRRRRGTAMLGLLVFAFLATGLGCGGGGPTQPRGRLRATTPSRSRQPAAATRRRQR
jgi:hypothetical protein